MRFTDVIIRNVLAIGDATINLDGLGLVMIDGVNLDETAADSNGSGKSSIADAISWCLWGKTARGITGDEIINTPAGKDAMVSTTVDDDGEMYRVDRYRKALKFKNGLFLYRQNDTGEWDDITKGTNTLTQKLVERLLGCSEEVFNAAVYSGQESMPDIPRMTDKELKTLVEQAAGVDVLGSAYEVAREKHREVSQTRAQTQVSYDRTVERHGDAKALTEALSVQSTDWVTEKASKSERLKAKTIEAKKEYELAKGELDDAEEKELTDAIAVIEAKIAAVNEERERETVLTGDVSSAEATVQTLERKIDLESYSLKGANLSVERCGDNLKEIKNSVGKPCKTCTRPLEDEHLEAAVAKSESYLTEAKAEALDWNTKVASAQARLPAANKMLKGSKDALAKHRASMTDVSGEQQHVANQRRELQIVETAKREVERLRVAAVTVALQWQEATKETNPFNQMIDDADKSLVELGEEVKVNKVEAINAQGEEAYAQAVCEVFSPSGVRALRLDEATPYLNERTTHYLGSLTDGAIEAFWTTLTLTKAKGELREKFSVTVEKPGITPTFNGLSGGEKRKVRLACALALQDLVATRAAKNIELWIGDEIDEALDDAGLERLMGVLEEKARDRGTVLVISHNDIRDFARRSMTVTKKDDRATVSVW